MLPPNHSTETTCRIGYTPHEVDLKSEGLEEEFSNHIQPSILLSIKLSIYLLVSIYLYSIYPSICLSDLSI